MALEADIIEYLRQEGIDAASPAGKPLFHACFGFTTLRRKKRTDSKIKTIREKNSRLYAEIIKLRKEGFNRRAIGRIVNCSEGMVRLTLTRLGDPNPNFKYGKRDKTIETHAAILVLRGSGMLVKDIAKKFGLVESSIYNIIYANKKEGRPLSKRTSSTRVNRAYIKKCFKEGLLPKDIVLATGWSRSTVDRVIINSNQKKAT